MPAVPALSSSGGALVWRPDRLLGAGFEETPLGPATLVRATSRTAGRGPSAGRARAAVLHVHGYNDYFFQAHLADALLDAGCAFYAVDLRRAGRSLLDAGGTGLAERTTLPPHYVTSMRQPGADLSAAARAVRNLEPGLPLVVHAHSTGGLTAAVWAHAVRDDAARPDLLVLDSPFLDLAGSWLARSARSSVVGALARRRPLAVLSTSPSVYATCQHVDHGGRWDFDTRLKRTAGQPARAGWLAAVLRAQRSVARGLRIACPVLVARSDASGADRAANPRLDAQDTVLDVRSIARLGPRLGPDVTELVVSGGVHDLTLSADRPRAAYLEGVLAFVDERLASTVPTAAPPLAEDR